MTNPWAGNGSAKARTRNAASTTVADTARHVADLKPAAASRRPPSERQIADCTASVLCGQTLCSIGGSSDERRDWRPLVGVSSRRSLRSYAVSQGVRVVCGVLANLRPSIFAGPSGWHARAFAGAEVLPRVIAIKAQKLPRSTLKVRQGDVAHGDLGCRIGLA